MTSIKNVGQARLTGKKCIITGAGRGIGLAIAQEFANQGATVVVTDIDGDSALEAAKHIGCDHLLLDVRSESDWSACANHHPTIDVLVNNAGITGFEETAVAHDPENASLADWRAVHATNLDGVFLGCRYAIKAMREKASGSIINISSRSGLVGIPLAAAYASSKAAVRNHTKSVALYCAQQSLNIRCNSIHPAAILTPMWDVMLGEAEQREETMRQLVSDTPLQRFGTVSEVASLAVLLASDESAYMTGSELTIDGGLLAGSAAVP